MSAFLVIQQRDRVEILTDGAVFNRVGELIARKVKAVPTKCGTGMVTVRGENRVASRIEQIIGGLSHFDSCLALLDQILDQAEAGSQLGARARQYELVFAGWSQSRGRPEAWFIVGHDEADQPRRERRRIAAPVFGGPTPDDAALEKVGFTAPPNPNDFRAEEHGLLYFEAMRHTLADIPFSDEARRHHIVGCFAHLSTISPAGHECRILRQWPDQIGSRIRP